MEPELWRRCAAWLTRCGILREDHKANWPQSSIGDLAYTLRDGVLLCNLLVALDPICMDIKEVNQRPQMAQFLCLRNIKIFLQTCRNVFRLRDTELFEPSELFDLTGFHKVLITLSKLSQSKKIQHKNILGFSADSEVFDSQEDIYKDLQSNGASDGARASGAHRLSGGAFGHDYSMVREEETYQDLCAVRKATRNSQLAANIQTMEKRDHVIRELVDTETKYVEMLENLLNKFMVPLSNLMRPADLRIIFNKIQELYDIHLEFCQQLQRATLPKPEIKLSEVFLSWREKFLIYGDYCSNLTLAQDTLRDIMNKEESVNQQVIKCQKEHSDGRIQLRDILPVPMQRLLKYHLLLDKLVSETTHEDYRGLERAKEAMIDVAQYINEVKRDSELLVVLNKIQDSISELSLPEGTDLRLYGKLILDGELRIKAHEDQKQKTRYVFIFDKIMLLCKNAKLGNAQYTFRESIPLHEYRIDDSQTRRTLGKDTRFQYSWFLVRKRRETAYTLYAHTEEKKRNWIRAMQEAMDNVEPAVCMKTDHKFVLKTFDRPLACHHCSKFLKGRIFQGYKCESCGIAVHKTCIANSGRCGPPQPPPPPANVVDRQLAEYLWYVGEMGRDCATRKLDQRINGTYLLRVRPQGPTHPDETPYALSLKTDDKVKHMKVYKKQVELVPQYYLSESRYFKSIVDLIAYYERTSLGENYVGLDVSLQWPFHQILAIAEYNFEPDETNQLPLVKGCEVLILSKEGDERGWWRGKVMDRVGFFPKDYVRETRHVSDY
ncbi:protein vav-like [Ctenocephalides felis]|uniref:protein vav-like n=1 Tax=Ctenocephalides felis TaxID=7515 RepID=UPI000E6E3CE5|nr:protein vav-like [Ctenocephalides felis]